MSKKMTKHVNIVKNYKQFLCEQSLVGKKISINPECVKSNLGKILYDDNSIYGFTIYKLKDMLSDVEVVSETTNKVTVILRNGKRLTIKKVNIL